MTADRPAHPAVRPGPGRTGAAPPVGVGAHRVERAAVTAFGAFRDRHHEPYVRYAALRIGRHDAAERVVSEAFTELAVTWTVALGSAGPAAVAWDILHDHIGRELRGRGHPDRSGGPARSLPLEAQVLHRRLRLSSDRVAEVLGISPGEVPGLLPRSAPLKE